MNISFMNQIKLKDAYGILCASVPIDQHRSGLYPTFCQIPKAGQTDAHSHFEPEIFYIINGLAEITINDETKLVSTGDLIRIPPFSKHQITNVGEVDVEFLSIYSEDFEISNAPKDVLITSAPPTPNGPLHLGHLGGPYLASDILARSMRKLGSTVHTHSGTDDHQNYVSEKANSLNANVHVFQKAIRNRIVGGLKKFDVIYDDFIEPKSDHEYQFKVLDFATRAIEKGIIQKENLYIPYCSHCEIALVDALLEGHCPHCQSPSRGGCESCGLVVPAFEILDPHCSRCGNAAETRMTEVYVFDLIKYLPLISTDLASLQLPKRAQKLVDLVQKRKSLKVLVSHPHNNQHGLRLPGSIQNLHVWFEMAAHYEQFAKQKRHWVHFFGFDNSFYYLLFIPSLLRAMDCQNRFPTTVVINEFMNLAGSKFSTSRNHAIWADDFTGKTDHLRLYLSLIRPANQESDFILSEFDSFSEKLDHLIQQILNRATQLTESKNPSQKVLLECHRFKKDMEWVLVPEHLDLRQASRRLFLFLDRTLSQVGDDANDYLRLKTFALEAAAFMPNICEQILIKLRSSITTPNEIEL